MLKAADRGLLTEWLQEISRATQVLYLYFFKKYNFFLNHYIRFTELGTRRLAKFGQRKESNAFLGNAEIA